jgi:hypothetical protein
MACGVEGETAVEMGDAGIENFGLIEVEGPGITGF